MTKQERELFRVYLKKEIALFLKERSEAILAEFCKRYNIDPQRAKDDSHDDAPRSDKSDKPE